MSLIINPWSPTCPKVFPISNICTRRQINKKPKEEEKKKFGRSDDSDSPKSSDSKFNKLKRNMRFSHEMEECDEDLPKIEAPRKSLLSDSLILIHKITDKTVF